MGIQGSLLVLVTLLHLALLANAKLNRNSFPSDFILGSASSAYQNEGAAFEDGKGPSVWDNFTHKYPEKITGKSNGDVATDLYHMYKDDVKLLKFVGLDAFRLSISWSRILPHGKLSGGVNKAGIAFYNNLINDLLSNGIQPFVTLYHWDLPQALEDEYTGFLSPLVVYDFVDFAEVCFKEFGDRVKYWMTMNEPSFLASSAYDKGLFPPGRCSDCGHGNSSTEPYVAAHHLILCHAATVSLYKDKYQISQKGQIGIALLANWMVPYSNTQLDVKAAQRALDFQYGWFMEPLVNGDYPSIMRTNVRERLPNFSAEQRKMVKGSFDFIGLNYYTSHYAAHLSNNAVNVSSSTDSHVNITWERDGKTICEPTGMISSFVCPKGLRDLLIYTKEKYNNPTIYITESGMADNGNMTMEDAVRDHKRVKYFHSYLMAVQEAIKVDNVKVKGFFAWSFLDSFEWTLGFSVRFGMFYVDFTNEMLKRYPKYSALWFRQHFHKEEANSM